MGDGDAASAALPRVAVWNQVPVSSLFESIEEVAACSLQFVARQHREHGLSGIALAATIEAEPFSVLDLGTLLGLFKDYGQEFERNDY